MQTRNLDRPALCYLNGRRFHQTGNQWIDAQILDMPLARRVRVRFDSREYFELLNKHRAQVPCVHGARNLLVAVGDTIYEIHE